MTNHALFQAIGRAADINRIVRNRIENNVHGIYLIHCLIPDVSSASLAASTTPDGPERWYGMRQSKYPLLYIAHTYLEDHPLPSARPVSTMTHHPHAGRSRSAYLRWLRVSAQPQDRFRVQT